MSYKVLIFFVSNILLCQDTFSIVAVDPITGHVGSAGASCIQGSIIISDVHPGVGVIHTQALWNQINQDSASMLMAEGHSPEYIIDWLINNDAENNPNVRQYGVVNLIDGGGSAAFTGQNCYDYKNHILGPNYSIQGNILIGQEILDSMEYAFLNQYGTLDEKLMASMMAANIPGADTRCLDYETPAISAFIRIASQDNVIDSLYLDINIHSLPLTINPIDSLYTLYWEWKKSKFQLGDLNFDDKIDVFDAISLSDYINSDQILSDFTIEQGDMNNSGDIEITDFYLLIFELVGTF